MVKALECGIVVRTFEIQSCYYVQQIPLEKVLTLLYIYIHIYVYIYPSSDDGYWNRNVNVDFTS